jgi:hypothetical protein
VSAAPRDPAGATVRIAPLFALPRAERLEGVLVDVRSVPRLPSDRPAWSRVLEVLGVVPIIVAAAMAMAVGIMMRLVLGGRAHRGGFGRVRLGARLLDRARDRRGGSERATLLELDTADGRKAARLAVDPGDVPVRQGEHVVVVVAGSSNGALRGQRIECGGGGSVRVPSPMNARVLCGALVAAMVALSVLGALAGA